MRSSFELPVDTQIEANKEDVMMADGGSFVLVDCLAAI
jgi:hypothetical protein